MTVRVETLVMIALALAPLVPVLLPSPPPLALPAPKIAGLLPERILNRAESAAARRIAELDRELYDGMKKRLAARPAYEYRPLFP